MPAQVGIPRTLLTARVPTPTLQASVDVRALYDFVGALQREIQELYKTLARRSNEMLLSGTLANRPDAGIQDRIYFATDQAVGSRLTYDDGTAWVAP